MIDINEVEVGDILTFNRSGSDKYQVCSVNKLTGRGNLISEGHRYGDIGLKQFEAIIKNKVTNWKKRMEDSVFKK